MSSRRRSAVGRVTKAVTVESTAEGPSSKPDTVEDDGPPSWQWGGVVRPIRPSDACMPRPPRFAYTDAYTPRGGILPTEVSPIQIDAQAPRSTAGTLTVSDIAAGGEHRGAAKVQGGRQMAGRDEAAGSRQRKGEDGGVHIVRGAAGPNAEGGR